MKQYLVAQRIGVSAGFISRIASGEEEITAKVIFGLVKNFAELNIRWLLTGEGEMFLEKKEERVDVVNEPTEKYEVDVLKKLERQMREMEARLREAEEKLKPKE